MPLTQMAPQTPSFAKRWATRLGYPNDSLDHHKPADLLRTGKFRRALGAIDAMPEGVFV